MGIQWKDGYSARVELSLIVDGKSISVGQIVPETLILQEPTDIEPCFADLVVQIDDFTERHRVALFNGASKASSRVAFQKIAPNGKHGEIDDATSNSNGSNGMHATKLD